jgi:hypothetical protein
MISSKETQKPVVFRALLTIFLCLLALSIVQTSLSLLTVSTSFLSVGAINGVGVGIYSDSACTSRTYSVNWGTLERGTYKLITLYIKNEGSVASRLSMTVNNWTPSNTTNYVTLTWNYANQTLSSNAVQQITLKLTISSAVSGITNFSFNTIITASG